MQPDSRNACLPEDVIFGSGPSDKRTRKPTKQIYTLSVTTAVKDHQELHLEAKKAPPDFPIR